MYKLLNRFLDQSSEFLARRKGFLPIVGLALILANYVLQLFFADAWISATNLCLHLGLIIALIGIMVAWAL
jgi:hypothetical protein